MAKILESAPVKETPAERKARKDRDRMTARIREAQRLAAEFEASRDPRELVAS